MRSALLATLLLLLTAAPALGAASPPPQGIVHDVGSKGSLVARGGRLYAANCASCHGSAGEGISPPRVGAGGVKSGGPPLRGVGALGADLYLRAGYMPLESADSQPSRSPVLFTDGEIRAMVAYVASLGHGPAIPTPRPGSVSQGQRLFTDHCAGCHQIAGRGGYVTDARVPPLMDATPRQVAQAVRVGPYLMPRFSAKAITPGQLDDIVAYVEYVKHPHDPGGWGLNHLGPWPEGMVAWLLAGTVLVATCVVIGRRLRT